ncbi:MAG: 2-C-methyl-D-erythritol 4-phosphate cytidylyltransferase [Paludibacteraceae bacterium]|nr:2-C-methyl-D-erythritol 4-phosphate cytidylyltransferase [Paludibacteraceae bacterium]
MKNIAIILAGGIGSRVGGSTPKQLLPLKDGRSVLEHSVDAFEQSSVIDEIAIVMHPDWLNEAQAIVGRNNWQKVKKIIPGGKERWESSWNAIEAYSHQPSDAGLWLHDCARPFVSRRILSDIAEALETHPAVTVAVPATDTIYITENNRLVSMPARSTVLRAQTPQSFRLDVIRQAYEKALATGNIAATDDTGIVHKYMPEQSVFIVPGEEANRKITFIEDLK